MQGIFEGINHIFRFIGPLSDFLWEFPTNFEYYAKIPLLGNLSFAIILLVGSGLFFSFRLGFMQVTGFKRGVKILTRKKTVETGISPLASFFLSTAMRVGPGNIIGVTGAIAVGGPGALFWMWLSAFFGMATAYMEATLSQIFKEKKEDEFVGGLPFYGRKLLGNKVCPSCHFLDSTKCNHRRQHDHNHSHCIIKYRRRCNGITRHNLCHTSRRRYDIESLCWETTQSIQYI